MKTTFLRGALPVAPLFVSSLAQAQVHVVKAPPALNSSGFYVGNRAPLQPSPFLKLPPGAVAPRGWLQTQLQLDADGLVGQRVEIAKAVWPESNSIRAIQRLENLQRAKSRRNCP